MSIRFEFDGTVSLKLQERLKDREKAVLFKDDIKVNDLFRLYPTGLEESYTFRCTDRLHEVKPDPEDHESAGEACLVVILTSI